MYIAIHSPDYQLVAVFKLDDQEFIPTQRHAADEFYANYCSEFCTKREYPDFASIPEIL